MKLNESIIKNLTEMEKWKNTEEDAYIEINVDGETDVITGNDILDYGTFRGFDKRGDTIYIVIEYQNTIYVYSVDTGFPFTFKKVNE